MTIAEQIRRDVIAYLLAQAAWCEKQDKPASAAAYREIAAEVRDGLEGDDDGR